MDYNSHCSYCMESKEDAPVCPSCGYEDNAGPASPHHLPPGSLLHGKYRIGRVLGQGGFGITYLGWDQNLDIKLAVKEFFPQGLVARKPGQTEVDTYSGEMKDHYHHGLESFLKEAKTLARFSEHPNIINVRDFFQANGTAYMVMNYIEGITLEEYVKDQGGRIPYEQTLKIMMPILDALKEIHQAGIMHRDVSPDNIFIHAGGRIILIDFGAARQELQQQSHSLSMIMRAGYSPIEQYQSKGKQGPWTDVYATAATFYRCIAGQAPPESFDRMEEDTLKPPSDLEVQIDSHQEEALLKALSVRAKDRFQSVEDFQKTLLSGPVKPQQKPPLPQPVPASIETTQTPAVQKEAKKNKVLVWIATSAAAVFVLVAVGLGALLFGTTEDNGTPGEHRPITAMEDEADPGEEQDRTTIEAGEDDHPEEPVRNDEEEADEGEETEADEEKPERDEPGEAVAVTGISLNHSRLTLTAGQGTGRLTATIAPADADNKNLTWSSSNPAVATVRNGEITPLTQGTTTITARTDDGGKTASCQVTVVSGIRTISWEDGSYEGEVKNNSPHGEGAWEGYDGWTYVGQWQDGHKHGQGTATAPDGRKWVGQFSGDLLNGQATYTSSTGEKYVGSWRNDAMHGRGTWTSPDGYKYEGDWKYGYYHGQGKASYADGSSYVGEWREGDYHGQGTLSIPGIGTYVGQWQYGMMHGQGTMTFPDGSKVQGEWRNDEFIQ